MEERKYEIFTSENGFSVRDNETGEIVHRYDETEVWSRLKNSKTIDAVLDRIINNTV